MAAERPYGSGSVALIGFDPTVDWIAKTDTSGSLWRRLLPARTSGGLTFSDDSMLVNAVSQLPTLALPPITGLLALLIAYIVLIGPINYLVLKRLDRREWAWVTMPILIVVFAAGAYAYGAVLRGSDVIVNEIAIVRGAPGATEGSAQAYLGVFSPSRSVYQVSVPGGALLSTSINGDMFGGVGTATVLDVLQGDPARVRDLAVGFGSLRTIRAETPVAVPLVEADLRLEDGRLKGTVKNASTQVLERPAVVLGQTVAVLDDLEPGAEASVDVAVQSGQFTQSLSDKVVGQMLGNEGTMTPDLARSTPGTTSDAARTYVRHFMVDQLTYDPNMGTTNLLSADGPVVLAWGSNDLLPVEIAGQKPRHLGNVLYYLPARLAISGKTTFRADMLRSTVVESDAVVFNRDATSLNFGRGSVTLAYRPVGFEGRIAPTQLTIGLNFGEKGLSVSPEPIKPLASIPPACVPSATDPCKPADFDNLAEIELFDVQQGAWKRLPRFQSGTQYAVDSPARYVDPTVGNGAGPVRQRLERQRRVLDRRVDQRGHRMSAIVRTEGLVKRYDRTVAVAGIDLAIDQGEIFGLVGPNGAGKTTTLRMLATLLRPDAGTAEIDGWSVTRNPDEVRRVLGFMPDAFGVYDDMKVWEYLDFFARCYGLPAAGRRRMIGDLLELVDLGDRARRLRPGPVARDAATAVPGPRARPRPAGAAPRRAGVGPRSARPGRASRAPPRAALDGQDHRHQQPHPSRARGAVHERGDRRSRPGPGPGPCRRDRAAASLRSRPARAAPARGRRAGGGPRPVRGRARRRVGDDPARRHGRARVPRRRRGGGAAPGRPSVAAGLPVASFARAASDLEELFLQVTANEPLPVEAA